VAGGGGITRRRERFGRSGGFLQRLGRLLGRFRGFAAVPRLARCPGVTRRPATEGTGNVILKEVRYIRGERSPRVVEEVGPGWPDCSADHEDRGNQDDGVDWSERDQCRSSSRGSRPAIHASRCW